MKKYFIFIFFIIIITLLTACQKESNPYDVISIDLTNHEVLYIQSKKNPDIYLDAIFELREKHPYAFSAEKLTKNNNLNQYNIEHESTESSMYILEDGKIKNELNGDITKEEIVQEIETLL
ncbi:MULTISPECIES: hypothetical protein [Oceanobacillus]|uniref:Lipoprotein n=1 Tax=Oceanobacillus kimchii TaxID=746691 RepID=A0ABQ5TG51_9BACI|nr:MULTISPECIES: hypothetical protein [Oceanobacillus]MBT2598846.1 hypothetical protein [Oceanobacillus sp. ISL-74]MBT2651765.1 hypothetical protein [Oceanobacillus sp. ISL-73]OEH54530.1 hypothetical protein AQ616_12285 [Oceanobacillus sp. E9]GLO65859.1 hypothetical protein MACH08_16430 [Oceanobacillus kimchii]